ncbi:hypothetical protein Shyhy01_48660 [Streptomyces hygroscopicus subsp. hygroscopicus]|nr:hypothetical protein Shyhy01_48660 [Streptomyces hygroscopicus subsp. hygroscopicus]
MPSTAARPRTPCDWVTSHPAARLPAVGVSVEHRLLAPGTPLPAAADGVWDILRHVVGHAARWGVDPARTAVSGESCGALVCALAALRARGAGLDLRTQVLVNPATDVTGSMLENPRSASTGRARPSPSPCCASSGASPSPPPPPPRGPMPAPSPPSTPGVPARRVRRVRRAGKALAPGPGSGRAGGEGRCEERGSGV